MSFVVLYLDWLLIFYTFIIHIIITVPSILIFLLKIKLILFLAFARVHTFAYLKCWKYIADYKAFPAGEGVCASFYFEQYITLHNTMQPLMQSCNCKVRKGKIHTKRGGKSRQYKKLRLLAMYVCNILYIFFVPIESMIPHKGNFWIFLKL